MTNHQSPTDKAFSSSTGSTDHTTSETIKKPGSAAPSPANSYEENPRNDEDLIKAARSIPIKDYSDYEITIETKTDYADALFNSDDDLERALQQTTGPDSQLPQSTNTASAGQTSEGQTLPEPGPDAQPTQPVTNPYDFSEFLDVTSATETASGGSTPITALNGSAVAENIDFADSLEPAQALIQQPTEQEPEHIAAPAPNSEPKSLAEKIKLKAKQKFDESKAQFDEYIGRSLPERELPLDFTFPVQKSKKDFDNLASGYTIRKLFEDKGKSILSIFRQANQDLAKISKCQMLASSRHSLLDAYSEPLVGKTLEAIENFERKPVLAGDGKRLELAEHCLGTFKSLINGYKQVYVSYYEAANVVYGPQRNTANAVVSRLFGLLLLEAQLCFALHSRVPAISIKTINKLFIALRLYEPQIITLAQPSLVDGEPISLKAIYFHFQILQVLDGSNISSLLYRVATPYIKDKLPLISLLKAGAIPTISGEFWVINHDQNTPAKLTDTVPAASSDFPSNIIDISRFLNSCTRDYAESLQHYGDKQWKSRNKYLASIKQHYCAALLAGLNQSVQQHRQSVMVPHYSIYQPARIRSYSGPDNIHAHFNFSYALANKKPVKKGEPTPELPPKPALDKAQWQTAKEDQQFLYMQLSEAETNAQIDIGQMLLLIQSVLEEGSEPTPEEGVELTTLAVIHRIERIQTNKINLTVRKLSHRITHATLQLDSNQHKPVLFAIGDSGPILLTDHSIDATSGQSYTLTLPDQSQRTITLDRPLWITQKFQASLIA